MIKINVCSDLPGMEKIRAGQTTIPGDCSIRFYSCKFVFPIRDNSWFNLSVESP